MAGAKWVCFCTGTNIKPTQVRGRTLRRGKWGIEAVCGDCGRKLLFTKLGMREIGGPDTNNIVSVREIGKERNVLKFDELRKPGSCLNKASSDEPVFVLRAKDPIAPMTIRHWATMAVGEQPEEKLREARELADTMDRWRSKNFPQVEAAAEDMPKVKR